MIKAPIIVPQIVPTPPDKTRTTNDRRGDRIQFITNTQSGLPRANTRGKHQTCQTSQQTSNCINANLDSSDIEARDQRGLLISANGIDMPAEACMVEHDVCANRHDCKNDHGNWKAQRRLAGNGNDFENLTLADEVISIRQPADGSIGVDAAQNHARPSSCLMWQ